MLEFGILLNNEKIIKKITLHSIHNVGSIDE